MDRWFAFGAGDALTGVYSDSGKTLLTDAYEYDLDGFLTKHTDAVADTRERFAYARTLALL